MRIALLAAFPFPLAQGSQIFVRDQARALGEAGAELTLFCYGSGEGPEPDGLRVVRVPRALSPRGLRAGPSPGKPLADAALAATWAARARRGAFDVALAHNGEAALAGVATRALTRVPLVYVAHTLLACELDAYAPAPLGAAARGAGRALDRTLAARADGVLALCETAARHLGRHARGPLAVLPPGLDPAPAPGPHELRQACDACGVEPGAFALYTGNVDRYQDLEDLARAARSAGDLPVLVATHGSDTRVPAGLRCHRVSPARARALTHACAVAVLPRRRPGGFPVKLLNYMEAGRAIVAREEVAAGLEHGRSAWLLGRDAPPEEMGRALQRLARDPAEARRLGFAARAHLESHHAWPNLARRTLELLEAVRARGGRVRDSALPGRPSHRYPR